MYDLHVTITRTHYRRGSGWTETSYTYGADSEAAAAWLVHTVTTCHLEQALSMVRRGDDHYGEWSIRVRPVAMLAH